MCHPVTCQKCHRTTWAGCGRHVAEVRAGVPEGEWCEGHPAERRLLGRLFGKR